jgi:hypothetical protein
MRPLAEDPKMEILVQGARSISASSSMSRHELSLLNVCRTSRAMRDAR